MTILEILNLIFSVVILLKVRKILKILLERNCNKHKQIRQNLSGDVKPSGEQEYLEKVMKGEIEEL